MEPFESAADESSPNSKSWSPSWGRRSLSRHPMEIRALAFGDPRKESRRHLRVFARFEWNVHLLREAVSARHGGRAHAEMTRHPSSRGGYPRSARAAATIAPTFAAAVSPVFVGRLETC
jgi:hypothetical protein